MSGSRIIVALLRAYGPLRAQVAAEQIKAAALPENVTLPALLVRSVSLIEQQPLTHRPKVHTTERIAVTVRAASYRDQEAIIKLVRSCCRHVTGSVDGIDNVAVLTAGTGPDVRGPGISFEKTTDFRVSFDADA
jgi:hypothetical protein